ncbi:hypothetical protein ABK040_016133 [Willaertia magna]
MKATQKSLSINWSFLILIISIAIGLYFYNHSVTKFQTIDISAFENNGYIKQGFEPVKDLFIDNFRKGKEYGGTLAVYLKGEKIIDLFGGFTDYDTYEPCNYFTKDTVSNVQSISKAVSSLVVADFIDRGLLNYNDSIVKYWPEFGQSGKENFTISNALAHELGLVYLNTEDSHLFTPHEAIEKGIKLFEKQKPLVFEAINGQQPSAYHTLTHSLFLNEIVKRVDKKKRNIATYFKEEIAPRLNLKEEEGEVIFFKLPKSEYYRFARPINIPLYYLENLYTIVTEPFVRSFFTNPEFLAIKSVKHFPMFNIRNIEHHSSDAYAENPSYTVFTNGRTLAKIFTLLSNQTLNGNKPFGKHVTEMATIIKNSLKDQCLDTVLVKTNGGYYRPTDHTGTTIEPKYRNETVVFGIGNGGSMVIMDYKRQLSISFTTTRWAISNGLGNVHTYTNIISKIFELIDQQNK